MPSPNLHPLRNALGGMLAMAAVMGIGRFVYTPILPGMMQALGQTASQAGMIASANLVGYLAGALLAAFNWAHGRERGLVLLSLAANAVLLFAMAATDQFWLFLAIRFLGGLATAFVVVFASTLVIGRVEAAGRPGLQAVHFVGPGIGIALSALTTGAVHQAGLSWRAGWIAAGLLASIAAILAPTLIGRETARNGAPIEREPPLPRDPALTRILISYSLFGAGYIVTATFLVAIVRAAHASQTFEAGVWVLTGLTATVASLAWSPYARRFGPVNAMAVAFSVEAVGVIAAVALPMPAGPIVGAILLGGTMVAIIGFGLQAARAIAWRSPRRVLAMMTVGLGVMQIIAPILAGFAADATGGFTVPSIGAAAVLVLSTVIAWPARARN